MGVKTFMFSHENLRLSLVTCGSRSMKQIENIMGMGERLMILFDLRYRRPGGGIGIHG